MIKKYTMGLAIAALISFSASADDKNTNPKNISASQNVKTLSKGLANPEGSLEQKVLKRICPGDPGCPPPIDTLVANQTTSGSRINTKRAKGPGREHGSGIILAVLAAVAAPAVFLLDGNGDDEDDQPTSP